MKSRDFRRAFGKPDADFVSTLQGTLRRLREEEERPMKRKWSLSAAIALAACLIFASAALAAANHWGLFDFLNQWRDAGTLPEAAQIVVADPPQAGGEGALASFRLREAVYDGEYAYLIVDATPAEGLLLLGPDALPPDGMRSLTRDDSSPLTIGEYAEANGLQMAVVSLHLAADAEGLEGGLSSGLDWRLEPDGTLVFMLSVEVPPQVGDALEGTLLCSVTPLIPAPEGEGITVESFEPDSDEPVSAFIGYDVDAQRVQRSELSFTLTAAGASDVLAAGLDAAYPGCGVRVDAITLTPSPMALYYEIHYTVTDEAAYAAAEEGVFFEFLDEDGERLPDGAGSVSSATPQEDGSFVQSGSLAAQSGLPEHVTLRAYNCWTKERYESHELTLSGTEP